MKKITSRAIICIILALLLLAGTLLFVFKFVNSGGDWAAFPSNKHLYTDGTLNSGRILDAEGVVLASYEDGWKYHKTSAIRRGTLHSVGDPAGVIGTGAFSVFADKLTGYNIFTGSKTLFSGGRDIYLTIDSEICAQAWKALGNYKGAISIYNYKTGEIICMVSNPTYDPKNGIDVDNAPDGVFQNNVTSGLYTPGSVFKLITATAALEQIKDIDSMTFECDGTTELDGSIVTCPYAHGTMNLEQALNKSCNGVFAQLALKMGSKTMEQYVESTGLTSNYSINGITTKSSVFDFDYDGSNGLA
ncbi:MAG: penicillin-binding protein, partial [Firmicutes bacterium]|nr:penicillin-binding protein [Bacillota bacterium]